jgi:hypothetical protein
MTLPSFAFFSLPNNCFYNSNYNYFPAPNIFGLSIYVYIYAIITGVLFVMVCIKHSRNSSTDITRALLLVCWMFCLSVIAVQTVHQAWYLNVVQRNMGHMSDDERYARLFEYSYEIARSFSARVPPGSPGLLVAGLDLTKYPIDVTDLPYFLFPRLDVVHRDRIPQYVILFLQESMVAPVSGKFRPVVIDAQNHTALLERVDDGR